MGRNNQARRAAKAKERRARRSAAAGQFGGSRSGTSSEWTFAGAGAGARTIPPPPLSKADRLREVIGEEISEALDRLDSRSGYGADRAIAKVLTRMHVPAERRLLVDHLRALLRICVESSWELGWQPADLHRIVGRRVGAVGQLVVADEIADQLRTFAVATLAPRWPGQLREIGASVWWPADTDPLSARAVDLPEGFEAVVAAALRLVVVLGGLPRIERLDPLPGAAPVTPRPVGPDVDERILARVRALLAKAESTPYEAEAETFTAGAQALMARHSIDAAMLASRASAPSGGPTGRRIGIDRPYEAPKVALLDAVATANRCRTVWSSALGFVTVVGHETDLVATETIFTSLLLQATGAMTRESAVAVRERSRTRAFRSSFLTAFAQHIGERLCEATRQATDEAVAQEQGERRQAADRRPISGVLQVLDRRAAGVDDAVAAMFPELVHKTLPAVRSAEGWAAGSLAAQQASLFGPSSVLEGQGP